MIKIDKRTNADGTPRTQMRVVEGYRPGPGMPTKQRTIRDFGCLEDQEDPKAFMAKVKEFNANYRAENVPLRIEAPGTARMYCEENRRQNYGYKFLAQVYYEQDYNIQQPVEITVKKRPSNVVTEIYIRPKII